MTTPECIVNAAPCTYRFPYRTTALIVIDMQRDFIEQGGFGESLGNDVTPLAHSVPAVAGLLAFARRQGLLTIHTRESHLPDLSDCPPSKLARRNPMLRSHIQQSKIEVRKITLHRLHEARLVT
ncbi:cysteine hydrolase family protein [Noviherbaspirillum sp. Root189]|uniref:cysteine hydrolase family protein n=1 Tax=Noviherbaspirillum sp. Root189 TaxID=1736487 RepID=UPI00070FDB54|nr:hypothetical protein ASE07_20775 [Noviherbaspirillum sp. Root189]